MTSDIPQLSEKAQNLTRMIYKKTIFFLTWTAQSKIYTVYLRTTKIDLYNFLWTPIYYCCCHNSNTYATPVKSYSQNLFIWSPCKASVTNHKKKYTHFSHHPYLPSYWYQSSIIPLLQSLSRGSAPPARYTPFPDAWGNYLKWCV